MRVRMLALAAALALGLAGCDVLKDPIEPWQFDVSLQEVDGKVVSTCLDTSGTQQTPCVYTVDGPYGFIVVTNDTIVERGFGIEELSVFEKIRPSATRRVSVQEADDGETYEFFDFLHHPDGTERAQGSKSERLHLGTMKTEFRAEDER